MNAIIEERGNGFAEVGDYVSGGGCLYRVAAMDPSIHTTPTGPNYACGEVEEADWSDITDEDDIRCTVRFEDEDASY